MNEENIIAPKPTPISGAEIDKSREIPIKELMASRRVPLRELVEQLAKNKDEEEKKKETAFKTKKWSWPFKWKGKINKGNKERDMVVVLYLNIKGELEEPIVVPLYSGNMVIIRNKVYEIDPRAFWITRVGFKTQKVVILREMDRRPVSNLDYDEVKARGDCTDSDEFLIKAALRAQTSQVLPGVNKWVVIGIILIIVVGIIWFLAKA